MKQLCLIAGLLLLCLQGIIPPRTIEGYTQSLAALQHGRVSFNADILEVSNDRLVVRNQATGEVVTVYGYPQAEDVSTSGKLTLEATPDGLRLVNLRPHPIQSYPLGRVEEVVGPVNGRLLYQLDTSFDMFAAADGVSGHVGQAAYGYGRIITRFE